MLGQRIGRRIRSFSVKKEASESTIWTKQLDNACSVIFPKRWRKGAKKGAFVNQIEGRVRELVRKKISQDDVVAHFWKRFLCRFDGDRGEIDCGHLMAGAMERLDCSEFLTATGDQYVAFRAERSNESKQARRNAVELPRSVPTGITLRPEIRSSAVAFLIRLVQI